MSTTPLSPVADRPLDMPSQRRLDSRATESLPAASRIGFGRLVDVEMRKMFDTRSGFWLLAAIGITAVLATAAVIAFAPSQDLTYATFGAAIGIPMTVLLPILAILSVTSEWSQRSGLSTFTLVPHRGRVIGAKAVAAVLVGVGSMVVAFAIGAVGNVMGTAIAGTATVWDMGPSDMANIVLGNVLGLLMGFTLGVLVRGSAGAVVGYFVYAMVLPPLAAMLAGAQEWFGDLQPWVDFNYSQSALFEDSMTSQMWAQLGTSGTLWLLLPLAVGMVLMLRSEVK